MSPAEVMLLIKARDEASRVISGVKSTAEGVAGKIGTAFKAGGLLAAGGIGVAGAAMINFVKAAAEEQIGVERLRTAIGTLDAAQRSSAANVEQLVRQRERLAFSDDQIRNSLSQLIPATGSYEEAVRRQKIAMDVARGTGLDLATTSRLLGKVNEESVNVFKRYGITIRAGASEQEALAAVQAKFAGQSEAYANTAAGKWAVFNNQMANIKETIGAALLPVVTALGAQLGDFLLRNQDAIARFANILAEKIPSAIAGIVDAFNTARPTLEFVFDQLKTGFETIRPVLEWILNNKVALTVAFTAIGFAALLAFTPVTVPILAVVAALGVLLFAIGIVRNNWDGIKSFTLAVWQTIADFINERLGFLVVIVTFYFETYKNIITTAINVVRDVIRIVLALLAGDWGAAWAGVKQLLSDVWNGIVTDIGLKLGLMRDAVMYVLGVIVNFFAGLGGRILGALGDLGSLLKGAGRDIINGLWSGMKEKWEDVKNWLGGLGGAIKNLKGPIERDRQLLVPEATAIMQGFGEGLQRGWPNVANRVGKITQAVPATVAAATQQQSTPFAGGVTQIFYVGTVVLEGDPRAGLEALGLPL